MVDDWDLNYSVDGNSTATVSAYDGFTQFANQSLTPGTATVQSSGARINAILDDSNVNWGYANRLIDTGDETLQADVIAAGQDVIQYINTIENTEPGLFFVDAKGNAVWKGRNSVVPSAGVPVIADDGSGIGYSGIRVIYGSELLYNQSTLTRLNGATAIGNDYISQSSYGVRNLTQTGLLHNTDDALANLAAYLVNLYKNPEFRFEQVDFALHDMSVADRSTLLNLEIGSMVKIVFTPNNIPPSITKYAQVIGIDHDAAVEGHHIMSIKFQTTDIASFVLNDTVFGLLDLNTLSY